jgi:hypothetical protein
MQYEPSATIRVQARGSMLQSRIDGSILILNLGAIVSSSSSRAQLLTRRSSAQCVEARTNMHAQAKV